MAIMIFIFKKNVMMEKVVYLFCFYIGLWGILGLLLTIFLGFLACCLNLNPNIYYGVLTLFAASGIVVSSVCAFKKCRNMQ